MGSGGSVAVADQAAWQLWGVPSVLVMME